MISPLTRLAVWDTLCDLEADVRYCVALSDRRLRLHKFIRFGLLVGVLLELALVFIATQMPSLFVVGLIFGLLLGVVTIWDAMSTYASDAARLQIAAQQCGGLKRETELLWRKVENYQDDEALVEQQLELIQNRWSTTAQWIPLEIDAKLKSKTETEAAWEINNRYVDRV